MIARNRQKAPEPASALPAFIAVIICSLPHFLNISAIAILICLTIWSYRVVSLRYRLPEPGLLLRTAVHILLFAIAVGLNEGLTLEAFVTLLIFMISLKTFELRTKRDSIVTIILCYFLIFSSMLFNDSIFIFIYLLLTIVCITSALIIVNFPRSSLKQSLALAGRLSLQAMPFMVILFLLFPRIHGGLWGRPPGFAATSGFSDEITFGTVSRVAQSKDAAFRVSFSSTTPGAEQLYWRGIVLSVFDGRTWREAKGQRRVFRSYAQDTAKLRYTVTLEPHNQRQLFALDLPTRVYAPRSRAQSDYTWVSWRPLTRRLQYTAESVPDASPPAAEPYRQEYLQLPEMENSRALAAAARWRSESDSDDEYVDRVISYFQNNNFTYTLTPQTLPSSDGSSAIDSFLFDSREGFCEYYASAFAFLMRAGGIPVRLVAGYLGGEVNPYGDYLIVRQSDAHVWTEVFTGGTAWQRIDPTVAVAPARLSRSLTADAFSQNVAAGADSGARFSPHFVKVLADLSDLINNRWNNWVLGYSRSDQIQLFEWLGVDLRLPGGVFKALVFGSVALAACGLLALALMRKRNGEKDKVAAQWLKFCSAMERIGIPRPAHQGPMAYAQSIIEQRPDLERTISEITSLYMHLRFNPRCRSDNLPRLIRAIQSFDPLQKS
jgi:transglutaminase-like putative cysteine protease